MSSFKIIEYNNEYTNIEEGDFVKISVYFDSCYDIRNDKLLEKAKEHIWTCVKDKNGDNIRVEISNHMVFKPIDDLKSLDRGKIITIKNKNIKELKKYTRDSYLNTLQAINYLIDNMPLDYQLLLKNSSLEEREEIFEQLVNILNK
tara:strand:- start:43 stop:480 length:438 start_codon:yes stop_codon:yes gene_type:complete